MNRIEVLLVFLLVALVGGYAQSMYGLDRAGVEFIKKVEGYSSCPYKDGNGYSVGYGHNGWKGGCITRTKAIQLLYGDISYFETVIANTVKVPLTRNQHAALVSFLYNVGETQFKRSDMLEYLNEGRYSDAAQEFKRWVYYKKQVHKGLVKRRQMEQELFLR